MIVARSIARRTLPVAILIATGACFATRNDVRVLQGDLNNVRAEMVRNDAARSSQIDRVLASLQATNDSIKQIARLVSSAQVESRGTFRNIQEQLLTIQELAGQSQKLIQQTRAQMEETAQKLQQQANVATDTAAGAGAPGPAQLFQLGQDQLNRGSAGAARAAFEDLIARFPTHDLAPDAQLKIADSFKAERNEKGADSVYQVVTAKFARSPQAATALYKHALYLISVNRTADARRALDQVVKNYPRSDEAELARDRLKTLK